MIKLLIGGSPCTHWSIAQTKNRETTASGLGWELFKNYLYAKERFNPDFFLYENNKSAAQAIKDQISDELGVELMYINSALVSAQNRQRFYAFNWKVEQPRDRQIYVDEILEGNSVCLRYERTDEGKKLRKQYELGQIHHGYHEFCELHPRPDKKTNTLTTVLKDNPIAERIEICQAIPINTTADGKAQCLRATCYKDGMRNMICNNVDRRTCVAIPSEYAQNAPIYEVKDGFISIKDSTYPIELADGFYAIRKLTVAECARLQTMPDDYCKAVSKSQAYKGLGNGWTAEVIIHILSGVLANVDRNEKIVVLSMYDGIGTGRYCLDKMGFKNIEYYAYEIDKYAMRVANDNYPDIIQCGDAFQLRNDNWSLKGGIADVQGY